MESIDEIGDNDIEIPKIDAADDIFVRMIRNNRSTKHIAEDTGYSEEYIKKAKEINEIIAKVLHSGRKQ